MLPEDNILKQQLFGIVSWIVFTSTIIHGITIPFFLIGSSLHPFLHPKFLVQATDGMSEAGESSSLLHNADEGEPIDPNELDNLEEGSISSEQRQALLGEDSGLRHWGRGKVSVYNQGSQLVICDEHGESIVDLLPLCIADSFLGNVSVRRIQKSQRQTSA